MVEKTFNEENNELLSSIFDDILNKIKKDNNLAVELYVTNVCNQKCEYCYLVKNGDKLYPPEIRDEKTILKNLRMFLNYLSSKQPCVKKLDIFSGEIWHTTFGYHILDILLEFVKERKLMLSDIIIPSNFTFLLSEEKTTIIEKYINTFFECGVNLSFSCSNDGLFIEAENRPLINSSETAVKSTDEYYDKLFKFCKKYNFGFHPMVNAHNIAKWPRQFNWWIDKLQEFGFDYFTSIMFLEVRNDEWTDEKIEGFLKYLDSSSDYVLNKVYNFNYDEFLKFLLGIKLPSSKNYLNHSLYLHPPGMSCIVDRALVIRLGDLSWVPCHRTSYEPFIYGKFNIENDKIKGLEAHNIQLATSIFSLGYQGKPVCDKCGIARVCARGCLGAQFESSKELFYTCKTVCNLYKAKTIFLVEKIKLYMKYLTGEHFELDNQLAMYESMIDKLSREEIEKWKQMSNQILKTH